MDWRTYCRDALLGEKGRIVSWIDEQASGDEAITAALRAGGLASFPHTTLDYSGEMTTRVVTSLYASGVERVVALGVIHAGALSEQYRRSFDELLDPHADPAIRKAHLDTLSGAFIRLHDTTAFGGIRPISPIDTWRAIRTNDGLLSGEFCLDYFLSILQLAADRLDREPLAVIPIYSGFSFDPTSGSFSLATQVASEIAELRDGKTAFVITGDLVHYGTNYSEREEMEGKPTSIPELERYFLPLVNKTFGLVTKEKDYLAAFNMLNDTLHNDQRLLLPVVGELLGDDAGFQILEFHLSDYAPIWKVPPPCVVASSLVTFTPRPA